MMTCYTNGTRSPVGNELSACWCGQKDTSLRLTCNRIVAYLQPAYCVEATYLLQLLQPLIAMFLFTLVTVWSKPKSGGFRLSRS